MISRETSSFLRVESASKSFDDTLVLDDISLTLARGEVMALLGPSGSGKSTLLRCIAGLLMPDRGHVRLEGRDITQMPPHERGFGMMFQQFALFPHRTVAQNIAFGLKMQGASHTEQCQRVEEMLELVGLAGFGDRSIFELSGGEQQRVALARSLAPRPRLLMLDEPLGSLDRALREQLVVELRTILAELRLPVIYVTHDQQEAFTIADRLMLLHRGRKVQEGPPETLYQQPATRFAAAFFGLSNQLPILSCEPDDDGSWRVRCELGELRGIRGTPSQTLLLRPDAAQRSGTINRVVGTVEQRLFRGGSYRLTVRYGETRLDWDIGDTTTELPTSGEPIELFLRPDALTFVAD